MDLGPPPWGIPVNELNPPTDLKGSPPAPLPTSVETPTGAPRVVEDSIDSYNIFFDCGSFGATLAEACRTLNEVSLQMRPELVVVNGDFSHRDFLPQFQDLFGLKVSGFKGTPMENLVQFCRDYPAEWILNLLPRRRILGDVVGRYKRHRSPGVDQVFLPVSRGDFDLSGHLVFMNYFTYRKLDSTLTLQENFYELARWGIKFIGTQGVTICQDPQGQDPELVTAPDHGQTVGSSQTPADPPESKDSGS